MSSIVVRLENILTDADNPVDLSALPVEEAAERIKDIYGFLRSAVTVEISDGVATITLADEKVQQADMALQNFRRASEEAKRGRYERAIPLFNDVLRVLPDHTEARRELAMALMETGSSAAAKKHLIRVLQLNPDDAWAYLILGNLYFQHEDDMGSADRYYTTALELAPDDAYIMNSVAGLKAKRGNYEEAKELFLQAIEKDPTYPNPRYGLALCHAHQKNLDMALDVLDQIFAEPESSDPRHSPVYGEARKLFVEIHGKRAEASFEEDMAALYAVMDAYSERSGIKVKVQRDDTLQTTAKVELAWRYGRQAHIIKYIEVPPAAQVRLLAHEFEHILLEEEARAAGETRVYGSTTELKAQIENSLKKDLRRLKKRSTVPEKAMDEYIAMVIDGQINQLYNMPLDLIIDSRVYEKYAFARDSLIVSIAQEQEANRRIVTDREIRNMTPTRIYQANVTLNATQALFLDELTGGATDYAASYREAGALPAAQKLLSLWRQTMDGFEAGDEIDLVDAIAQELKLEGWYIWIDQGDEQPRRDKYADRPEGGGPSNPGLLEDPALQMAATMYMLSALRRFDKMDDADVHQVAAEIAVVGMSGLDYSSSEKSYTLRYLPGESFSGLQLMCLMYVGFKKVEPGMDSGIPLDDAYAQALQMHRMGM